MSEIKAAVGGERYVPLSERDNNKSVVYFTKDISPEGIKKVFDQVAGDRIKGKIAVKLHTGEKNGPNFIPSPWVKDFIEAKIPSASIVETNTFYEGDRYTTEQHRETLEVNGWNFCPVDIMDEDGTTTLPVAGHKWISDITVGDHMTSYDSLVTLTHFKGHAMGGFGGSNKNIGIGCADGRIGKKQIHQKEGSDDMWSISAEELMERITESTKGTIDFFGENVIYINVMRNMSVSCDCEGLAAEPVVTPNVGILASTDICAIDTACVDLIYTLGGNYGDALRERIETRHGHRQLTYMHEMGMGSNNYTLYDVDNNNAEISLEEAVADVKPFKRIEL